MSEKEDKVTGFIYGIGTLIMLIIMLLGPVLWALGYGGDKWEYYLEHKTQEVMTRTLL